MKEGKVVNMANVVHFNMLVEINQLLKDNGIEYSIHSIGACTCAGLRLRQDGKSYPVQDIIHLINEYLEKKWMRVIPKEDDFTYLQVVSKFEYEKR